MSDNPTVVPAAHVDDAQSEFGGLYDNPDVGGARFGTGFGMSGAGGTGAVPGPSNGGNAAVPAPISVGGITRGGSDAARPIGRGPIRADPRKFHYDRNRALVMQSLPFAASKADRMDAKDAGELLHRIHQVYGIDRENENVLEAFDKALFFEHTINGASLLQPGRGKLYVGDSEFEITSVKQILGVDQRRFFRAFADEVTVVNREVIAAYDPYDPVAAERHGQLVQVAVERGLQKYPYLAHDSSDAGLQLTVEERVAIGQSKRLVLPSTQNNADRLMERVPSGSAGKD